MYTGEDNEWEVAHSQRTCQYPTMGNVCLGNGQVHRPSNFFKAKTLSGSEQLLLTTAG